MIKEGFILTQSDTTYAGKVIETRFQWRQMGDKYVFFQYCDDEMVARFKLKFKC